MVFFARPVEPALLVMFQLSSISMFKSAKCSHNFLTVSLALPLSDLMYSVKNVTPVSGYVSLIGAFSFRSFTRC